MVSLSTELAIRRYLTAASRCGWLQISSPCRSSSGHLHVYSFQAFYSPPRFYNNDGSRGVSLAPALFGGGVSEAAKHTSSGATLSSPIIIVPAVEHSHGGNVLKMTRVEHPAPHASLQIDTRVSARFHRSQPISVAAGFFVY